MLASALASGASVVSADVPLDSDEAVIGSFTVDGLTFAVNADGVTLVSIDPSVILSVGSEAAGVEGSLSIPPSITYEGMTYPVTAIGPYALYLSGAAFVELPATVVDVDKLAFRSSDVAWVEVDPANETYASSDGIIYDATFSRLLLIPGGRQGAVRIDSHAEEVPSSAFSHCAGVMAISVDAGGAAYSSWDGLLYDASGSTLLRVPAGAVDITIREGCTTIAAGAMEGCVKLERINAPATVTSISPDVFESVPTVSLPASVILSDNEVGVEGSSVRLSAIVALSSVDDSVSEVNPAAIGVSAHPDANLANWRAVGFLNIVSVDETTQLLSASTYAGAYTVTVDPYYHSLYQISGIWNDTTNTLHEYTWRGNTVSTGVIPFNNTYWFGAGTGSLSLNSPASGGFHDFVWLSSGTPGWTLKGFRTSVSTTDILHQSENLSGNRHFIALWEANRYAVSFDANGGSGGQSADVTATFDSAMPTISTTKPTRAGYTFGGWYDTSASTGGTQYYTAAGASARTWNKPNNATLYARWSGNTITCTWSSNGGSAIGNTSATYSDGVKVPMPASSPTRTGYVFAGWWTAADGGTEVTSETALPTSNPTYHAHWTPAVSADVPLEVTARVDRLGLQEQTEASGYIESHSGGALDVTDAEFEPLPGAATLFGSDTGSVSLVGFGGTSATPLFTFALDTASAESNAGALSPLTMASYGTRIPIRYHFDIPDELLPALMETTLPVCQVSYTVALA